MHNFKESMKSKVVAMIKSPSEIVREALDKSHLTQGEFSKKLGRSQPQISKYLSGKSTPTSQTLMHCMNIIEQNNAINVAETPFERLAKKVKTLDGDQNAAMCVALLQVIDAYERSTR